MHRLQHVLISVYNHLRRAAALYAVARDDSDETVIGIGIDKHFDIEHIAKHGVGKHKDTLHNDHITRLHRDGLGLPRARQV